MSPESEASREEVVVPRPAMITREGWGSQPQPISPERRHTPQFLTVHHAGVLWEADDEALRTIRNLQRWGQTDKAWPDLPYHFLIAPDGTILEGRPLEYEPESNTEYELAGNIGMDVVGNFEEQRVSPHQLRAIVDLLAWLAQDLDISPDLIRTHRDVAPGQTSCPGRDFYRYFEQGLIQEWVEQRLAGEEPSIEELPPLPDGPTEPIPVN